jgi:HK97 family phage major capsid protein
MTFQEKNLKLKGLLGEAKAFWDKYSSVDPTDLPKEAKSEIDRINKETAELGEQIAESKQYQELRAGQEKMAGQFNEANGRPDFGGAPSNGNEAKTLGRMYTESPEYKALMKHVAPQGSVSTNVKIESDNFEVKNLITGASVTRAAGGSGMVRPDYQGVVPFFLRPLTLRDVFTTGRTSSDLVEFTQITSFDNQAAPTAEATVVSAAGVVTGGLKPQSGMTTSLVQAGVKTIPHWMPITRRALADAPQLETYIDNFLMQGAEIKLEDQMITGNNTGENLLGLDNTPGVTVQNFDTDALTTTRKARTKVRVIGRAVATAYLMSPFDWEALDLTKNTQGNYYFGGPLAMGLKTLWGLPVVESEAVLTGTFYTGDLKQAVLWDRELANVRISDSPNDFFLRNVLAILCELRAAFGVLRPAAIVRGDLLAGPNS